MSEEQAEPTTSAGMMKALAKAGDGTVSPVAVGYKSTPFCNFGTLVEGETLVEGQRVQQQVYSYSYSKVRY